MNEIVNADQAVRQTIDKLIQTATSYDIDALDAIYHDDMSVLMIDINDNVSGANKSNLIDLFRSKRDTGAPPMNTWAKYHNIEVTDDKAHVLLSRKNDLTGKPMRLLLSIDLIICDERWQVIREVISIHEDNDQ